MTNWTIGVERDMWPGAGRLAGVAGAAILFALAACGPQGGSGGSGGGETASQETPTAETGATPTPPSGGAPAPEAGEVDAGDLGETLEGMPATMNEDAFLASYAQIEGVVMRESGLMYRVLEAGAGRSPTLDDRVQVTYRGTLMDGTVFDETPEGRTAEFKVGSLIEGWKEALTLMKEGDRWEVVVPSNLGYGEAGAEGVIPPNSPLVFEVHLLKVL